MLNEIIQIVKEGIKSFNSDEERRFKFFLKSYNKKIKNLSLVDLEYLAITLDHCEGCYKCQMCKKVFSRLAESRLMEKIHKEFEENPKLDNMYKILHSLFKDSSVYNKVNQKILLNLESLQANVSEEEWQNIIGKYPWVKEILEGKIIN
jgi:arsenate reductase-like glutaredoxin family protein